MKKKHFFIGDQYNNRLVKKQHKTSAIKFQQTKTGQKDN